MQQCYQYRKDYNYAFENNMLNISAQNMVAVFILVSTKRRTLESFEMSKTSRIQLPNILTFPP